MRPTRTRQPLTKKPALQRAQCPTQPNLQILLRPLLNALESKLNVLDRIRHAEPQVALAKRPERGSRQRGHSCLFQQRVGQLLRRPARLLDIRKRIERALGQTARESLDLIDAIHEP